MPIEHNIIKGRLVVDTEGTDLSQMEGKATVFSNICSEILRRQAESTAKSEPDFRLVNLYAENGRLDDSMINPIFEIKHFATLSLAGNPLSQAAIARIIVDCSFNNFIYTGSEAFDMELFRGLSAEGSKKHQALIVCTLKDPALVRPLNSDKLTTPDLISSIIYISGAENSVHAFQNGAMKNELLALSQFDELLQSLRDPSTQPAQKAPLYFKTFSAKNVYGDAFSKDPYAEP
jgi:hypothetical protein